MIGTTIGQAQIPDQLDQTAATRHYFLCGKSTRLPQRHTFTGAGCGIRTRYGFSFYDSLIVAAALEAGCTTLYSEDMQDGQRIEGLTIRNPFAEMRTE